MRQIARNMVAEVCSVYVLRADGVLELYATEGLNKESVHHAQLKMGEGLVGTIAASAQPLNLPTRRAIRPSAYLPETGEELYSVLPRRADPARRPLARRSRRPEPLAAAPIPTTRSRRSKPSAMVLAEMVASGELKKLTQPGQELDLTRPVTDQRR